jgi:predicted glutamine amidotransferase
MFGYAGKSEADLRELHAGLKRACADDPTLSGVVAGCSRHSHGWGYVIHAANGLFHYRTATSIYDDDAALPKLEGEIRAIFHGRFASNPKLAGPIFCHPFVASADSEILFLAHNGSVQPDHLAERKVDSEWALEQIIQEGGVERALSRLKDHTLSALNILLLSIQRGPGTPATLRCLNYFESQEPPHVAYYRMYLGAMPGGRAFVSSTIKDGSDRIKGLVITGPAAFGELLTLEP